MAYQVQAQVTGDSSLGHGREFTAEVWDGFDPAAMDRDSGLGWYQQEMYTKNVHVPANTAITALGNGFSALTTNNTGAQATTLAGQGGILSLEAAASSGDNDEVYLQYGRPYVLATADEDDTLPYHHVSRVRFGVRFAVSAVTDDYQALFLGLAGQALATGALSDNDGELVSTFHGIGLRAQHKSSGGAAGLNAILDVVYQENGSQRQDAIAGIKTMVANTWYLFEMDFNPMAPADKRITYWFDGVKQSTYTTAAQVADSTFPKSTDDVSIPVGPTFMRKSGADAASKLYLGGWRAWSEPLVEVGNCVCG